MIPEEVLEFVPGGGVSSSTLFLPFPDVCWGPLDVLEGVIDLGSVGVVLAGRILKTSSQARVNS